MFKLVLKEGTRTCGGSPLELTHCSNVSWLVPSELFRSFVSVLVLAVFDGIVVSQRSKDFVVNLSHLFDGLFVHLFLLWNHLNAVINAASGFWETIGFLGREGDRDFFRGTFQEFLSIVLIAGFLSSGKVGGLINVMSFARRGEWTVEHRFNIIIIDKSLKMINVKDYILYSLIYVINDNFVILFQKV